MAEMHDVNESTSTFADRIKTMRQTYHLTQRTLAKAIAVTPAAVSLYETGRMKPSRKILERLSSIYGVNIEWLENGTGEMGGNNTALEIEDESTIGNRIKSIREQQGLTQKEFGARIGGNNVTVSLAERGYRQRNAELVERISEEFGISKEWIMFGTGSYELNREE